MVRPSLVRKRNLFRVRNADAEQIFRLREMQRNLLWLDRLGINVHDAFGQLAAGGFQNQLRRALAGPIANAHVRAALEAVAGFAAQTEQLARAPDVHRREIGALDEHVHGRGR